MNSTNTTESINLDPRVVAVATEVANRHGWHLDHRILDTPVWDPSAWILRMLSPDDLQPGEYVEVFWDDSLQWEIDVNFDSYDANAHRTAGMARNMARWLGIAADLADELNLLTEHEFARKGKM